MRIRVGLSLTCLLLATALVAPSVLAQYPRTVLAEDCTATWCGYCPYAYAGLEVMKSRYDVTEFRSIRYYATTGGLGSAETDGRISYYAVGGFPTVIFDGTTAVEGGSPEIATGSSYDPIVSTGIGRPAPLKITINSIDLVQPQGSIDFDIEVMETLPSISFIKIRVAILENNVTYSGVVHQDVTRDMLPEATLSVSTLGQVQNVVQAFAIPTTWKTADLWAAIFVQNDNDRSILQTANSYPAPAYSMRFWAKDSRAAVRPSYSAPYEFPEFAVYNLGTNADVIRVTLDPGTLPAGWDCSFTDGVQDFTASVDLSLAPGASQILRMKVTPGAPGYVAPKIVLTSANLPAVQREIPYTLVTDDVQVLVVDDDGDQPYQDYYATALAAGGYSYGVWRTETAQVSGADLAQFDAVVWELGLSYPTLKPADRAALGAYLDGGGRLFITGQELGWEMNDTGGAALAWYHSYMHANFVNDDANRDSVTGLAGDPISDGMVLSLASALNPYPDIISARDAFGVANFTYTGTSSRGALRVDTGVYRVVYLAFGYETITSEASRNLLLARSLTWLGLDPMAAPDDAQPARLMLSSFPNPALGTATLSYALPAPGRVTLAVFRPDGSLLRTLVDRSEQAGPHSVVWDGRDQLGAPAAAGVYFYRLETPTAAPCGKLILTR